MPSDLPKTTIRIITALLKHQANFVFGETASKEIADTLIGEDLQKRLDDWLEADKNVKELIEAAEQAHLYVQDPQNCPDVELRQVFHDMRFDNLPSVQKALTELPQALDAGKLQETLQSAFTRDLPNLTAGQHTEGARIYTDALLRAVGTLEKYTSPIILQTVRDNSKKLDELGIGQNEIKTLLDKISAFLQHSRFQQPPSPTKPGDLPPGSYLPFPRNHFFTGRVADLEKLYNNLLLPSPEGEGSGVRSTVINQAVTGMGGLGKTQLAVEFAYQYGYQFKGVHWLDLREAGTLESQIALCGSKMDLPDYPPTQPEQVQATLTEWKQNGPRLLILDNFEDATVVNDVIASLTHSNLRLLITSRRMDWSPSLGLKRLPLDEFSEDESLAFLRNYISEEREPDENLKTLAKHLGYLPLGLELAGRYLEKQPRLKIKEYLSQLEHALEHKSMQNWKAEQKSLTGHDLSLAQTFAQSWEQVTNPTTQKLFISLGYCAPNTPIPYEILDCALGDEKEACDECLSELFGLGLIKEDNLIHPLLTEYARSLDGEQIYLVPFVESLKDLANKTNAEVDQIGNYALYIPILPHVRALAEYAENASLEAAGSLWNSIGYHISDLADYVGAKAALERALKIDEATFGPDHPDVARDVNNLGSVLKALGELPGAKAAFEHALKILEKQLGEDHPKVATLVNNLGNVLKALGDLPGAKAAYERALKIDEAAFGAERPSVARDVNNLGSVLQDLGDYVGAKAAYERVLEILEKSLPPEHPYVAITTNNLGSILQALGDHAGAKAAYERALKIDEAAFGPVHPKVAIDVNNLGMVLKALGHHAGAKAAYERALKIDEAAFGPDHPKVARDVNNLGSVLQDLGDHAGAKAAFERALKIFEKFLPPDHPNIQIVRGNLKSL